MFQRGSQNCGLIARVYVKVDVSVGLGTVRGVEAGVVRGVVYELDIGVGDEVGEVFES